MHCPLTADYGFLTACLGLVGRQGTGMWWLAKLGLKAKIMIRGLTGAEPICGFLRKSWEPEQHSRAWGRPLTPLFLLWPAGCYAHQGSAPEEAEPAWPCPLVSECGRTCSSVSFKPYLWHLTKTFLTKFSRLHWALLTRSWPCSALAWIHLFGFSRIC